jgi:hypothetical protein
MKIGRVTEGTVLEVHDRATGRSWWFEVPKDGPRARTISMCGAAPTGIEAGPDADAAMEVARLEAVERKLIDG